MALGDLNLVVSAQVSGATQGLKQVDQSLQRVQGSMARANQATKAMTNQFNSARTSTQKWATGALQQAGYQIGDFAVQVANGTSKMQAFGQQGSQFLGILGPFGAVLGAGVAVISAFAVAAQRASGSSKTLADTTNELSSALSRLNSVSNAASMSVADLTKDYGANAEVAEKVLDIQESLAAARAKIALGVTTQKLGDIFGIGGNVQSAASFLAMYQRSVAIQERITELQQNSTEIVQTAVGFRVQENQQATQEISRLRTQLGIMGNLEEKITALSIKFGISAEGASRMAAAAADVTGAKNLEDQVQSATSLANLLFEITDGFNQGSDEAFALYQELLNSVTAGLQLQAIITGRGGIVEGAGAAADALRGLKNSMSLKEQQDEVIFDPRDPRYNRIRAIMAQIAEETGNVGKAATSSTTSLSKMANITDTALSGIDKMFTSLDDITNSVSNTMENAMTDAFMSIVDGTQKPIDAFKNMARLIIAELYKVLVVKQLVGSFDAANPGAATGIVGLLGSYFGGFRANGGPVSGGTPYVVGERGPELFVPSRNGTIVPNGAGAGVTVIQNNTFGNGVSRAEIQAMLPRLVETTKAAVFDAQRRSVNGLGYA